MSDELHVTGVMRDRTLGKAMVAIAFSRELTDDEFQEFDQHVRQFQLRRPNEVAQRDTGDGR